MLIKADREMSALVATRRMPTQTHQKTCTADTEKFIARQNGAGTTMGYDASCLCTGHEHQALASGFPIGQRFHFAKAVRVVDGCPVQLGHLNKADGR